MISKMTRWSENNESDERWWKIHGFHRLAFFCARLDVNPRKTLPDSDPASSVLVQGILRCNHGDTILFWVLGLQGIAPPSHHWLLQPNMLNRLGIHLWSVLFFSGKDSTTNCTNKVSWLNWYGQSHLGYNRKLLWNSLCHPTGLSGLSSDQVQDIAEKQMEEFLFGSLQDLSEFLVAAAFM